MNTQKNSLTPHELMLFEHEKFGKVRTVLINDEPWFVGKDLAEALGYKNIQDALKKHVDTRDKYVIQKSQNATFKIPPRGLTITNESGMYSLVFGSKLKSAKEFKYWVTSEVLPQIRKTRTYGIHKPDGSLNLDLIQQMLDHERMLQKQVAEMEPKVEYYNNVLYADNLISTTRIAKEYGMSARQFNQLLHKLGVQYETGGQWVLYQKYAGKGYTGTKTFPYVGSDGRKHINIHTYWTLKGRYFLYDFLKPYGYLPFNDIRKITATENND